MKMNVIELAQTLAEELAGSVRMKILDSESLISIYVEGPKEALGRLIGSKGRVARALRVILNAKAAQENKRVMLEISAKEQAIKEERR